MNILKQQLMKIEMVRTLFSLKGNARACLLPEPLWGIPYNLQAPYASLYMAALGLSPAQIGMVASINIVSQVIFAVLSGVITDKLGRRWTTVIFDTLSWSVPEFIWMLSQDFRWFVAGALFNGIWRVTETSWDLLLVDDMRNEEIMPAFSLTQMLGLISAFIAPLSKFAIDAFGFVPTMRVLYGTAGVSMTIKFLIVHAFAKETQIGLRRMEATKDKSILTLLYECKDVYLKQVLSRRMLLTFGILASYTLVTTLSNTYWALLVCSDMGISESNVVLFSTLKSFVTLICTVALTARIAHMPARTSILGGIALYIVSILLLLLAPGGVLLVPLLIASSVLEAASLAILMPTTRSLMLINAGQEERARVCGLIYATIALLTAVFPGLIGQLAEISLRLPFFVCIALFLFAGLLTHMLSRLPQDGQIP
ncbi:MAG: MFS transporter [Clostridia bacterium]|nr:MFS transporter [Clostridia bacterium]